VFTYKLLLIIEYLVLLELDVANGKNLAIL
jgi:hypothetical protein